MARMQTVDRTESGLLFNSLLALFLSDIIRLFHSHLPAQQLHSVAFSYLKAVNFLYIKGKEENGELGECFVECVDQMEKKGGDTVHSNQ